MAIRTERFGEMPDGREIKLYTLENANGLSASFTDLGGTWVCMRMPDKNGKTADVVLGFDSAAAYLNNGPHFGAIVGRIANRTAHARFQVNGKTYTLSKNHGEHNLHSGPDYLDIRLWSAKTCEKENSVSFSLISPEGDQGFPGEAKIQVTYALTEDGRVNITYETLCTADCPFAMTNHSYFNLAGHDGGEVLSHRVWIDAQYFTPTSADMIPTGEIWRTAGTPMDFTTEKELGRDIDADYLQLLQGSGFDHNWCLNHRAGEFAKSASAWEPESGRAMDVWTDMPGVQLYTANKLDQKNGKDGAAYGGRHAFCFETQYYPDAVNQTQFTSPIVKAMQTAVSKTTYHFYIRKPGA